MKEGVGVEKLPTPAQRKTAALVVHHCGWRHRAVYCGAALVHPSLKLEPPASEAVGERRCRRRLLFNFLFSKRIFQHTAVWNAWKTPCIFFLFFFFFTGHQSDYNRDLNAVLFCGTMLEMSDQQHSWRCPSTSQAPCKASKAFHRKIFLCFSYCCLKS